MLPNVLLNLGFAATEADQVIGDTVIEHQGLYLLVGTGCWLAPLLAGLVALWTR